MIATKNPSCSIIRRYQMADSSVAKAVESSSLKKYSNLLKEGSNMDTEIKTVAQLIEALKAFPEDAEVFLYNDGDDVIDFIRFYDASDENGVAGKDICYIFPTRR